MRTVAEVVEKIVAANKTIAPLGGRGLINVAEYARSIRGDVSSVLGVDVSVHAIQMALARSFRHIPQHDNQEYKIKSLTVHANLEAIAIERTVRSSEILRNFYFELPPDDKSFVTATQGINELTVIAEKTIASRLREKLKQQKQIAIIYDISDLSGITVKASADYVHIPNYFHYLISRLALEQINIVESVSTATETTFIIDRKDVSAAVAQLEVAL